MIMSSFEQRADRIASVVQVFMVLLWIQKLVVEGKCDHNIVHGKILTTGG